MALATDPRPQPNLEIYDFESQFEDAFQQAFAAHNLDISEVQQSTEVLKTPRTECQFTAGQQSQRSYIVPGTGNPPAVPVWAYPNVWAGSLRVKIITNRKKQGRKGHRKLRGLVRWMMQEHDIDLTAHMKYITVIQTLETGTSPEYAQTESEDISSITYAIHFNLKPTAFPTPS